MIICEINSIVNIATLITALSALITSFYLWYDRRARILVTIEPIDRVYYLKFENVGKSVARNVKINLDNEYINSLPVTSHRGKFIKEALINFQKRKFYFTPGTKKYYYLMQCRKTNIKDEFDILCNEWYEQNKLTSFSINISYNRWFKTTEEFFLEQFNSDASIPHTNEYFFIKNIEEIKNIVKEKL